MTRVGGKFGERCRSGGKEILVELAGGGADQPIEIVRQREHQMEIRPRQHLAPPRGEPGLLGPRLATRAMPVAAGVIDVPARPAIAAGFDVPAERRRAAGENGPPDLGRAARQGMAGEIGRTEGGQHLGQASRGHGS